MLSTLIRAPPNPTLSSAFSSTALYEGSCGAAYPPLAVDAVICFDFDLHGQLFLLRQERRNVQKALGKHYAEKRFVSRTDLMLSSTKAAIEISSPFSDTLLFQGISGRMTLPRICSDSSTPERHRKPVSQKNDQSHNSHPSSCRCSRDNDFMCLTRGKSFHNQLISRFVGSCNLGSSISLVGIIDSIHMSLILSTWHSSI